MVELFSQSRYFPQSRYSKKMRARKGATGGEPEGYAGRKIRIKPLGFIWPPKDRFCQAKTFKLA